MAIKMDAHFCGTVVDGRFYPGHDYTITFATEQQAIAYISRKRSTTNFLQRGDFPLDEYPALLSVLYPSCEHGLSAQLCYGPGHYAPDNVVDSWYVDPITAGF